MVQPRKIRSHMRGMKMERFLPKILITAAVLSGLSSLIYEMLWLKYLSFFLGSSAGTGAVVLAAFFLGLALGSFVIARFLKRRGARFAIYGCIELGIALGAVIFYYGYQHITTLMTPLALFATADSPWLLISRFIVATFFVFLPSFFMGATLPILISIYARRAEKSEGIEGRLYAWNTVGAVCGVVLAAFVLPPFIGYAATYGIAFVLNLFLALSFFYLDLRCESVSAPLKVESSTATALARPLAILAFISGFGSLALETLWHKMFSLVTINCVYSFAAIMVMFLSGLAAGAPLARLLKRQNNVNGMSWLLVGIAVFVAISPLSFYSLTDGLAYIHADKSWSEYVLTLFGLALAVIFVPSVLLGMVLPYLLQGSDRSLTASRAATMLCLNTLGAILGALCGGFVLSHLPHGMAILLVAILYLLAIIFWDRRYQRVRPRAFAIVGMVIILAMVVRTLPDYRRLNPDLETILETYHGPHGVVSVSEAHIPIDSQRKVHDLFIRLNNYYTLGGVGSLEHERRQGELPLYFANRTDSVFMIGLGTGITAGAILNHPIKELGVAELVPEVVDAAKKYFSPYVNGLFSDDRVHMYEDDGRSVLAMGHKNYDVIIADLFDPWGASTGALYSLENFQLMKERLHEDGLFVQWLPLYQLTEEGFGVIARTMLAAFPQVVALRGNFDAEKPTLALVGFKKPTLLDARRLEEKILNRGSVSDQAKLDTADIFTAKQNYSAQLETQAQKQFYLQLFPRVVTTFPYGFYVADLGWQKERFEKFPINTLDSPVFAYLAPRTVGMEKTATNIWLTGERLAKYLQSLQNPAEDPFLARLDDRRKQFVDAGRIYFEYAVASQASYRDTDPTRVYLAKQLFEEYKKKAELNSSRM